MRILVAIDGSPSSEAAVDEVCQRPWPVGSEVRLITVRPSLEIIRMQEAAGLPMEIENLYEHPDWETVKFLEDAAVKFEQRAPGLKLTPALLEGRAKDVILDEAEQWVADLIVIGSNGFGIVRHLFLGSVSLAVALNATCSVEIVRFKHNVNFRKILLAVDGSPSSYAAVDEVCNRPWPAESEVRVITVTQPPKGCPGGISGGETDPGCAYLLKQQSDNVAKLLNDVVTRINERAPALKVSPVVLEGRPKDVVLDDAQQWGADLIMVGSNGYGIIRHFILGSVALAVALNAGCSVKIVRLKGHIS